MAATILTNHLNTISHLEQSIFVNCYTIEKEQDGNFIVFNPYPNSKVYKRVFTPEQIEHLIMYLGTIKSIMLLDHNTDEETVLF